MIELYETVIDVLKQDNRSFAKNYYFVNIIESAKNIKGNNNEGAIENEYN